MILNQCRSHKDLLASALKNRLAMIMLFNFVFIGLL